MPEPYVSDMLMQAVRAGDALLLGKALHNDLQAAATSLRPMLRQVLEVGEDFGALGGLVSGPPGKVLAVTDQDLFIPILTFVFGEAQLNGRAAVDIVQHSNQALVTGAILSGQIVSVVWDGTNMQMIGVNAGHWFNG